MTEADLYKQAERVRKKMEEDAEKARKRIREGEKK